MKLSTPALLFCSTALLIAGAYHPHGDTGLFLSACGLVLGFLGLFFCFREWGMGSSDSTPD